MNWIVLAGGFVIGAIVTGLLTWQEKSPPMFHDFCHVCQCHYVGLGEWHPCPFCASRKNKATL